MTWSYFNPRSPRGERRYLRSREGNRRTISIHAPREGSDICSRNARKDAEEFQSTLPARGATRVKFVTAFEAVFQSTLPARGATTLTTAPKTPWSYFNPRSPRGERPSIPDNDFDDYVISIHAPREGSDSSLWTRSRGFSYFNPRSPRGERPHRLKQRKDSRSISIHAPREGSDQLQPGLRSPRSISIHAPREGSDGESETKAPCKRNFNPRSPRGERLSKQSMISLSISYFNPRSP